MRARAARFEIVRTNAGHHARFVAANGQTVWVTESYARRNAAVRAIELIAGNSVTAYLDAHEVAISFDVAPETGLLEVRSVDERSGS